MRSFIMFICIVLLSSPCFAYLDGGASSILLQLILGGLAGGMVFLKFYLKKITSYLKNIMSYHK